jgi:hypothetical protein
MTANPETYALSNLLAIFSPEQAAIDDFWPRVVNVALVHRAKAPTLKIKLESACHKTFRVKGFRDPSKVPNHLLAPPILNSLKYSDTIFNSILQLWLAARSSLVAGAQVFLVEKGITVIEPDNLRYGFTATWPAAEMWTLAREYSAHHAEVDANETALVLCCLSGRAPLLPDEASETSSPAEDAQPETSPLLSAPPASPSPTPVIGLPQISIPSAAPLPDMEEVARGLDQSLQQARQILKDGRLAELSAWAARFVRETASAQAMWGLLLNNLQTRVEAATQAIQHQAAPEDQPDFLNRLRSIVARCETLDDLPRAYGLLNRIYLDLDAYTTRRAAARRALAEVEAALQTTLAQAQVWQLSSEPWQPPLVLVNQERASLRVLELNVKIVHDQHQDWQQALTQAQSQFTAELLRGCEDLLARSSDVAFTESVTALQTRLMSGLSDDDLLASRPELQTLQARQAQAEQLPDFAEIAQAYQREPDQGYLEMVLEALAQHGRVADIYLVLSLALQSGRWQSGATLPASVIGAYFAGMQEVVSSEEALSAATESLTHTAFVSQIKPKEPEARLGLAILYASALAARPGCLPAGDLWALRVEEFVAQAPVWTGLINHILQGQPPKIRRSQDLPQDELRRTAEWIENDLNREGGRFVRSRGRNSITMTNMEQQVLLPGLEARWKTFKASKPGRQEWVELRDWLAQTNASQVFTEACHLGGVTTDDSPFYRPAFEERIRHLLEHFVRYATLREEIDGIQAEYPVLLDDALAEVTRLASMIGNPLASLVQLALAEIGEELAEKVGPSVEAGLERPFGRRLRRALLEQRYYWQHFPLAVAWLGSNALRRGEGWRTLFDTVMQNLAQPVTDELYDFYLRHNLPDMALQFQPTEASAAQRATDLTARLKEDLQFRQMELKKRKQSLRSDEEEWRAEGRWNLVLTALDERLEQLRADEKRQEQETRKALRELASRALSLEQCVNGLDHLPDATRDELLQALDAVRSVSRQSQPHGLPDAQVILQEVEHILNYESTNTEGVHRALSDLNNNLAGRRPAHEPQTLAAGPLDELIQSLKEGDYEHLGLAPGLYSETGWDDRLDLLLMWQRVKGLPIEGHSLLQSQIEDLRHLASLFSKIYGLIYGPIAKPGERVDYYLLREPVVHYESKFRQPGAAYLQSNVILVFLTEPQPTPRRLKELAYVIEDDQRWLRDGFFVVIMALGDATGVHDWARRRYTGKSLIVVDEGFLRRTLFSGENPSSIGHFKRALRRAAGPQLVEVFSYENYVDKEHNIFVGRDDWLNRLVRSDQSYAIYGGRRIGKSSLLKAVANELQASGAKAIYKSFEGADAKAGGLPTAQYIVRALGLTHNCTSFVEFKQAINAYFAQAPEARVVILLDELDPYIRERRKANEAHEFIETCRSLFQEHRRNIRFIMAGFIELWRHLRGEGGIVGPQNPYKNFLEDPDLLPNLPTAEAQEIVREGFQRVLGIRLAEPTIPLRVVEATASHPAFVQKFCERLQDHLHRRSVDELHLSDVEIVREDTGAQAYIHFVVETLDLNLNKLSQILVYLLAFLGGEQFNAQEVYKLAQNYGGLNDISPERVEESCNELFITSVFTSAGPGRYRFSVPAYPALLRQLEKADRAHLDTLIEKYNQGDQP